MTGALLQTAPMALDLAPPARVLHPGDVVCAERGARLQTLLGSCVAVVLTDPRRTVGVMCHIVHPGGTADGAPAFAAAALQQMRRLLLARSIVPRLCQAWVIGGGNMFPGRYDSGHIGEANADWVLQALARDGVQVLGIDVGGPRYRRLHWTVGPDAPQVTAVELPE